MKTLNKSHILLVAMNVVLMLALVLTWGNPPTAQAATTHKLWVGASEFTPNSDGRTWYKTAYLRADGQFIAPVDLPGGATVTKVQMYVYDNYTSSDIHLTLYTTRPKTGSVDFHAMAYVSTSGESTEDPQKVTDSSINYPVISGSATPFLYLDFGDWVIDLKFYGAKIVYTTVP